MAGSGAESFYPVAQAAVDVREDRGEFFPGGGVVPRQPVTPTGGDMFHSEFSSLDPDESSLADVINKLKGANQ